MSQPDTTIVRCPSCGAPISMGDTRGVCSYCETVVERRPGGEPVVIFRSPKVVKQVRAPRRGCSCLTVMLVLALLIAGAVVGFLALAPGAISRISGLGSLAAIANRTVASVRTSRISDLVAVVPRDADRDDLLALFYQDQDKILGLLDSAGQTLRWQTPALSKDLSPDTIALGPDAVFVADQTNLQALRLSDGGPLWQASLSVEPQRCDGCMQVIGERIIVLEKDGTLQAFDTRAGQLVWSKRLEDMRLAVPALGDQLVLAASIQGQRGDEIQLVNAASGAVVRRFQPTCAADAGSPSEATFSSYMPVLPSSDGTSLIVIISDYNGCVQRWDLGADAPAWETRLAEDTLPTSIDAHNHLITDRQLFIANNGTLSALDLRSGKQTVLMQEKDYRVTPLFARGAILVVKASPQWDSNRSSLWGLDATTGDRRWQYAVKAKEWFGDAGFNEWGAQLTPQGVTVVQVPQDDRQVSVERLNLETGVSLGRGVTDVPGSSSSTVVWDNLWSDRMAWLLVDNMLFTIDLQSGAVESQGR